MILSTSLSADGGLEVTIGGELTIARVGAFKSALSEAWDGRASLQLQLAEVERIDSAGLQLLLALAQALGVALRIGSRSSTVIGLMDLYRVGDRFAFTAGHSE